MKKKKRKSNWDWYAVKMLFQSTIYGERVFRIVQDIGGGKYRKGY